MGNKKYTYPNISSITQRGNLSLRNDYLLSANTNFNTNDFAFVEVPADFIKNVTEEKKTRLPLGAMLLNPSSVKAIYSNDDKNYSDLKYILHTEPQLIRQGSCRLTPKLLWYDSEWLEQFTTHVLNIIDHFGVLPYAIELHPGTSNKGQNSIPVFIKAIIAFHKRYIEKYGNDVLIFIENRTGHIVKNGHDMLSFWELVKNEYSEMTAYCGFVVDIQQLYTVTRTKFARELELIPIDSIKGCHIHTKHRVPTINDDIDWSLVRAKLEQVPNTLHVLPEVHHREHVEMTYQFCKVVLGL